MGKISKSNNLKQLSQKKDGMFHLVYASLVQARFMMKNPHVVRFRITVDSPTINPMGVAIFITMRIRITAPDAKSRKK